MSELKLSRLSGTGNTFLFWNAIQNPVPRDSRAGLARVLCQSFTGFFTDGLVFIENDSQGKLAFEWDFYNSDGSGAEMCGNAARCAALYFQERMQGSETVKFRTVAGEIETHVLDSQIVEVGMPEMREEGKFVSIRNGKSALEYYFVNTGVPHLVVEGEPDEELAKFLRRARELGSAGANITFFHEIAPGEVEAVTFERGVENFTLACGTGAVAAAAFSYVKNPLLKVHAIEMPGGSLRVEWESPLRAKLSGPTQFEFDLSFPEGAL